MGGRWWEEHGSWGLLAHDFSRHGQELDSNLVLSRAGWLKLLHCNVGRGIATFFIFSSQSNPGIQIYNPLTSLRVRTPCFGSDDFLSPVHVPSCTARGNTPYTLATEIAVRKPHL